MSVHRSINKIRSIWFLAVLIAGCGGGKPDIEFASEQYIVDEGASVNLTWKIEPFRNTEIASASIDQGIGEIGLIGETRVSPTENTRYTLTARADNDRTASKSLKVLVSKVCIQNTVEIPDTAEVNIARLPGITSVGNIIPLCDGLMYYSRRSTRSLYLHNIATGEVLEQYTFSKLVRLVRLDRKYARLYFTLENEPKIWILDIDAGVITSIDIERPPISMSVDENGIVYFVDGWMNALNQEQNSAYAYNPVSNAITTLIKDDFNNGSLGNLVHNPDLDEYIFTIRNSSIATRLNKASIKSIDNEDTPLTRYFSTLNEMSVPSTSFSMHDIAPDFSTFSLVQAFDGVQTLRVMDLTDFSERFRKPLEATTSEYSPVVYSPDGKFIAVGGLSQISIHSATDPEVTQYIDLTDTNCRYPSLLGALSYSTNGEYIYGVQFCGDDYNIFYRKVITSSNGEAVNIAPVALARGRQEVETQTTVQLDGSHSFDDNGDALSYSWTIKSGPAANVAEIENQNQAIASFTPNVAGLYTFELVVNDGTVDSTPATLRITAFTMPSATPAVELILPAEITPGTLVTLMGSGLDRTTLTLNNNTIYPSEITETSLRFTAPNLAPGTYELVIENRLGSYVQNLPFKVENTSDPEMRVTVSGLPTGTQIMLRDSVTGAERNLNGNGEYVLLTDVINGSRYEISMGATPDGYHCEGTHLNGLATSSTVSSVAIDCAPVIEIPDTIEYAVRGKLRDVGVGTYHMCYIDSYGIHCLGNAPDYGSFPALGCEFDPEDPCPSAKDMLEVTVHPEMGHPDKLDVGNNQACAMEGGVIYCWLGYTFNEYLRLGSSTNGNLYGDVIANEYEICAIGGLGTQCRYSAYPDFTWDNPVDVDINTETRCVLYGGVVRCNGDFFNLNTTFFGGKKLALSPDSAKVCIQTVDGIQCFHFGGSTSQVLVPDLQDIGFVDDKICALTSADLKCWNSLSSTYESIAFENGVSLWSEGPNYCVETQTQLICNGRFNATIDKL